MGTTAMSGGVGGNGDVGATLAAADGVATATAGGVGSSGCSSADGSVRVNGRQEKRAVTKADASGGSGAGGGGGAVTVTRAMPMSVRAQMKILRVSLEFDSCAGRALC